MVNGDSMSVENRLDRIEQKIDALTNTVETRLEGVETRLTKIELLAGETKEFSHNVCDSLTSLERRMDEGFEEARKDNKEQFRLVHAAIHSWGERVEKIERARTQTQTRKRGR